MSFIIILFSVLLILMFLSILFAVLKFFVGLLPVAVIAALIIWLILKFTKEKNTDNYVNGDRNIHNDESNSRRKARDVSVKDVDKKEGK